jgi:hypothetical protein
MNKVLVAIGLLAALAVPAGAAAKATPDQAVKREAAAQCKSERGKTRATREAFKAKYHSMGRCVRQKAAAQEAAEKNAAKECAAERTSMGEEAFADKYGTNTNGRNAFGKCVSGKAHEA